MSLPLLFAEYLIPWRRLPLPLDFKKILECDPPFPLEIGFGDGSFLLTQANREKERMWLGIEISFISVRKAAKSAKREGIGNVRFLKGDARAILLSAIPPSSLDEVYVLFPDPWPKKRHRKRRLMGAWFLGLLASRMTKGGKLFVETDDQGYREFLLEETKKSRAFSLSVDKEGSEVQIDTKYKRKWKSFGRKVYHIELKREDKVDFVPNPLLRFKRMPHEVLSFEIPLRRLAEAFRPRVQRSCNAVLAIKEVFVSGSEKEAVFVVHVDEGPLNQDVLVRARKRAGGLIVKLDYLGDPLITEGVKDAVKEVARLIKETASSD